MKWYLSVRLQVIYLIDFMQIMTTIFLYNDFLQFQKHKVEITLKFTGVSMMPECIKILVVAGKPGLKAYHSVS